MNVRTGIVLDQELVMIKRSGTRSQVVWCSRAWSYRVVEHGRIDHSGQATYNFVYFLVLLDEYVTMTIGLFF